jgi:hypothetical protein
MPRIDDETLKSALSTLAGRTLEGIAEPVATGASLLRSISELASGRPATGGVSHYLERLPQTVAQSFGLTPYGQASEREQALANLVSFLPEILAGAAPVLGMAVDWQALRRPWLGLKPQHPKSLRPIGMEGLSEEAARIKYRSFHVDIPEEHKKATLRQRKIVTTPLGAELRPGATVTESAIYPPGLKVVIAGTENEGFWLEQAFALGKAALQGKRIDNIIAESPETQEALQFLHEQASRKDVQAFYHWLGSDLGTAVSKLKDMLDAQKRGASPKEISKHYRGILEALGLDASASTEQVVKNFAERVADRFVPIHIQERHVIKDLPESFHISAADVERAHGEHHLQYFRWTPFPPFDNNVSEVLYSAYRTIPEGRDKNPFQMVEHVYQVSRNDLYRWAAKRGPELDIALVGPGVKPKKTPVVYFGSPKMMEADYEQFPQNYELRLAYGGSLSVARSQFVSGVQPPKHYGNLTLPGAVQLAFSHMHPNAAFFVRKLDDWPLTGEDDKLSEFFSLTTSDALDHRVSTRFAEVPFLAVTEVQSDIEQDPELRRLLVQNKNQMMQIYREFMEKSEVVERAWDDFVYGVLRQPVFAPLREMTRDTAWDIRLLEKRPEKFFATLMLASLAAKSPISGSRIAKMSDFSIGWLIEELATYHKAPRSAPIGQRIPWMEKIIGTPRFYNVATGLLEPNLPEHVRTLVKAALLNLLVEPEEAPHVVIRKAIGDFLVATLSSEKLDQLVRGLLEKHGIKDFMLDRTYRDPHEKAWWEAPVAPISKTELERIRRDGKEFLAYVSKMRDRIVNALFRPWGMDWRDMVIRDGIITAKQLGFDWVGFASGAIPSLRWSAGLDYPRFSARILVESLNLGESIGGSNIEFTLPGVTEKEMAYAPRRLIQRIVSRLKEEGRYTSAIMQRWTPVNVWITLSDFRDFVSNSNVPDFEVLYDNLLFDRLMALLSQMGKGRQSIYGSVGITFVTNQPVIGGYYLVPIDKDLLDWAHFASAQDTREQEQVVV